MYKRKRAGNTITRKINSTKDTDAKADKNHDISNSYLEGFIPIDTEYFTASFNAAVSSNIHARHLYERIGFHQLGTIPGGFRMKDGSVEDICPYYIEIR